MIDTPLEIFALGAFTGSIVTFLLVALLCGNAHGDLDARIGRLRRGLALISSTSNDEETVDLARTALDLDDRETTDA